jgi:TonB family protein
MSELLPTGEVFDVRLVKSSGVDSYDKAAESAIHKASPLPVPKDDSALFQSQFRKRIYKFRPND